MRSCSCTVASCGCARGGARTHQNGGRPPAWPRAGRAIFAYSHVKCKAHSSGAFRPTVFHPGAIHGRLGARAHDRDDLRSANRTRQRPRWRFKGAKPRPPKLGGASARATAAARATRSAQGTCHTHRRRFAWPSGAFCLAPAPPPRPRAPAAPPAGPQDAGVTA